MAASEAAELIMRVDDIIKCAPRKRERMWEKLLYLTKLIIKLLSI
jgi:hypothetical protein